MKPLLVRCGTRQGMKQIAASGLEPDKWSLTIMRVAGIHIRVHTTLLLVLGFIIVKHRSDVALFVATFTCLLLHELGHALTAIKLRYPIRKITLYPIGGVAALEAQPTPKDEFWITLAGPMVNIVIASLIWVYLRVSPGGFPEIRFLGLAPLIHEVQPVRLFLASLCLVNISLATFNLVPAFPMDGGRLLRAFLAIWLGIYRATVIAARIGQGLALLFALASFTLGNLPLLCIAAFVFIVAGQELSGMTAPDVLHGIRMNDVLDDELVILDHRLPIMDIEEDIISSNTSAFILCDDGKYVGTVSRESTIRALKDGHLDRVMSDIVHTAHTPALLQDRLSPYVTRFGMQCFPIVVVGNADVVIGVVTKKSIMEYLLINRDIYR